jgi:hypothetical protein
MLRVHSSDLVQPPYFAALTGQAQPPFLSDVMGHEERTSFDPFQPFDAEAYDGSGSRFYSRGMRNSTTGPTDITLPAGAIAFGSTGDQVLAIQNALFALGYFGAQSPERCDEKNVFGDKTMASLAT